MSFLSFHWIVFEPRWFQTDQPFAPFSPAALPNFRKLARRIETFTDDYYQIQVGFSASHGDVAHGGVVVLSQSFTNHFG